MADSLRTDYDRMVGESYKDYAARCRDRMLAAERDRDALADEVRRRTAEQARVYRGLDHLQRENQRLRARVAEMEQRARHVTTVHRHPTAAARTALYILGEPY